LQQLLSFFLLVNSWDELEQQFHPDRQQFLIMLLYTTSSLQLTIQEEKYRISS